MRKIIKVQRTWLSPYISEKLKNTQYRFIFTDNIEKNKIEKIAMQIAEDGCELSAMPRHWTKIILREKINNPLFQNKNIVLFTRALLNFRRQVWLAEVDNDNLIRIECIAP